MFLQLLISGLTSGFLYALIGAGFVIIYKATNILNIAQGEILMFGAFIGFTLKAYFHVPFPLLFPLVVIITALFGALLDLIVFRPLRSAPGSTLIMATLAIMTILQSSARLIWGDDVYPFPPLFDPTSRKVGGILITPQNFWLMVIAAGLIITLFLFFRFTKMGKAMRAAQQRRETASLMGISVKQVFSLSWAISSALAGITGVLVAPLLGVSPMMGWIGIKAFAAVILAGFNNLPGAIVGGLSLGILENLVGGYISSSVKEIAGFVILILVLVVRPTGLFGAKVIKKV
jgi:branched-chain amino acid transport system permease protein